MNNSSLINGTGLYTDRPWLRDEIFVSVLTAISVYLTMSLIVFRCRKNKDVSQKETKPKNKFESALNRGPLCLIAVIFCLIRCLFEQVELRMGTFSDLACRIYQHQAAEIYHVSLTSLYLLLWSRQVTIYRHRTLRHLSSASLRITSYLVIFGILACSIASATSYLVTFTLIASPVGCVYDLSYPDGPPSSLPGILLFIISFVFQFAILGLLVYPLIKHYRICCRTEPLKASSSRKVRDTVIRLSICTTICVISDGVSSYLLVFVNEGNSPISFWSSIYTANLLINIIAVICSFADWKSRLLPC